MMESPEHPNRAASTLPDGRPVACFAGCDYLGLAGEPAVIDAAVRATRRRGTSASAGPTTTGSSPEHPELARALAAWLGAEDAVLLSAGFLAALGAVTAVAPVVDGWFVDERAHGAIATALRSAGQTATPYRHCDPSDLRAAAARAGWSRPGLITDAVFAADGRIAPLPELIDAVTAGRDPDHTWIVVDEAHSLGVLGARGAGTAEHFDLPPANVVRTGVLSKVLAAHGGFVAASRRVCETLRDTCAAFEGSCPIPPGVAAAAKAALDTITGDPTRLATLRRNIAAMHDACGWAWPDRTDTPIFTIPGTAVGGADATRRACLDAGLWLPTFRYGGASSDETLRWTVQSAHDPDTIRALGALLTRRHEAQA